jgi:hypothetical protein
LIFGARRLAQRRRALVERSGTLRRALLAAGTPVAARAVAADRLVTAVRAGLPWIARAFALYSLLKLQARNKKRS